MGSGKSTVARALSDLLGWPVITSDKIGFALYGRTYFDNFSTDKKQRVNQVLAEIVREYLEDDQPVIVDRTHLGAADCRATHNLATSKVFWLTVTCSESEQERRLAQRPEGLAFWLDVRNRMRLNGYRPRGLGDMIDTTKRGENVMVKNCEHFTPASGRCRHRARVAVTYRKRSGESTIRRCWSHYLELENRHRLPDAAFTILAAKQIRERDNGRI